MDRRALILGALLTGCGRLKAQSPDAAADDVPDGAAAEVAPSDLSESDQRDATDAALVLPAECAGAAAPPTSLVCTGLYLDIADKVLAPGVEAYAPAVPLWSDGASKQRWISLPPGTKIDNSNPDEWTFPVGTKVWNKLRKEARRAETGLCKKW